MAKSNAATVSHAAEWGQGREAAEPFSEDAAAHVPRPARRTLAGGDQTGHLIHDCGGEVAERLAIRHHLDTLILKLAAAQAGSLDAVREGRIHALAALAVLDRPSEVGCEHARVSGLAQSSREWMCEGCGAHWPKSPAAARLPARSAAYFRS